MVGTSIGANRRERALRTAWIGGFVAAGVSEAIGLCAAAFPHAWLSLFGTDPAMLDAGSQYLRTVGPFYGFFGLGLALYFASQGAGRLLWPLLANCARFVVAVGGGWLALQWTGGLSGVFAALAAALVAFRLDQCNQRRRRRLVRSGCLAAAPVAGVRAARGHAANRERGATLPGSRHRRLSLTKRSARDGRTDRAG